MSTTAKILETTQPLEMMPGDVIIVASDGKVAVFELKSGKARVVQEPAPAQTGSVEYVAPPGQEYVDPYLFETGHFTSREEYEELSRTATIRPRARA